MSKPIRIAIMGAEANTAQRVGSNVYAYELLAALEQLTRSETDIQVTVLLDQKPMVDLPAARNGWQYQVFGPAPLWTQYALPLHLFLHRKNYDVLLSPGHYGPRISSVRYVSAVMDLAFLYFPRQFRKRDWLQLREWTRYTVKHAQKVIAISEHTKHDVMDVYHLPAKKIVVAYPGFQPASRAELKGKSVNEVLQKWHIKQPYLLYVGTLQPRKNVIRLVEAFEKVVLENESDDQICSLQLVIVGKVGWLADQTLERIKKSPLKNRIIVTGFVSEAEKVILYRESVATILVGLYEGFGIPALEAMAYGSIPVVSQTTSLPEVVDGAGVLVDPLHVPSIAKGIHHVLGLSAKERVHFLRLGREQMKKFQWEKTAQVVLHALKDVAQV